MVESLSRLSGLTDDLRVLPGHGRASSIEAEKSWLESVARSRILPF